MTSFKDVGNKCVWGWGIKYWEMLDWGFSWGLLSITKSIEYLMGLFSGKATELCYFIVSHWHHIILYSDKLLRVSPHNLKIRIMISFKFVLSSHQAKTMTTKYQQPVTSTLQLEEFRCKGPSLSTLSEGHQRQRWSESAAAPTVWVSPLSLKRNLFLLRMFTDPRKDKQPLSCL